MVTPESRFRRLRLFVAVLTAAAALVAGPAAAQAVDPPGFAPLTLEGTQVVRLNVFCFEHGVGGQLPSACTGEVMFHNAAGSEIKSGRYALEPGQTMSLQLAIPARTASGDVISRVTIIPCVLPDPGGLAIPSVEVFDRDAGRAILFANPVAPRMSDFSNGLASPGDIAGFDPQPDPPAFGMATIRSDQSMRMNVFCFEHAVNGAEPTACTGTIMFHDAAGNILRRGTYSLEPGQTRSFGFIPPDARSGATLVGIIPCVLPDPLSGRIVPNVEVMTGDGSVVVQFGPAAARASRFAQVLVR
jgi:hypothetical protein